MNEEEKKAIKRIYDVTHNSDGSHVYYIDIDDVANTEEDLESCEAFCKAIDTVLNLTDKKNKVIDEIRCEFLKYDWKNSNNKQVYNQLKSLYNAIFRKVEEDE